MKSLVGKVKVSYCAVHNTYPEDGEPCWGCANPFIESAYQAGLKKAAQQSVQPTDGILLDLLTSLTPKQLSALKVLLTPPVSG